MLTLLEFRHCKLLVIWNLFIGISTWAISVHAETIRLKSGQVIEGTVVARTEDSVKIDTGVGVPVTYYRDEIESIIEDPQAEPQIVQPPDTHSSSPTPIDAPEPIPVTVSPGPVAAVPPPAPATPAAVQTPKLTPASTPTSISGKISHKIEEKFPLYTNDAAALPPWQAPRLSTDEYLKIQAQMARNIEQEHINHVVLLLIESLTSHWRKLKEVHPLIRTIAEAPTGLAIAAIIWLGAYALVCYPLMRLSHRFKCGGWMAWVPILQIFQLLRIAGKLPIWFLFFLFPLVNILAFLFVWMSIARRLEQPHWLGYFMLIPVVNVLLLWYLALVPAPAPKKRPEDIDTGIKFE